MTLQRLPIEITNAPLRTVRPLMLRGVYANPEKEVVRLNRAGLVTKIAPGTYTAKPDTVPAQTQWRPAFEDAAMAYATAQYGNRVPVLYGIGAARFHHAIPRAVSVTVIAVPQQHRQVHMTHGGTVIFTTTDVAKIEARLEQASLGSFLVTTPEQTLIDLLARPGLGGTPDQALTAAGELAVTVEVDHVLELLADRPHTVRLKLNRLLAGRHGGN